MSVTYESEDLLRQYLVFHFAEPRDQFPFELSGRDALGFPRRCAVEGVNYETLGQAARALDVGCSVGRASFELARNFDEVVGIDYSQTFVDAANELAQAGTMRVQRLDEGDRSTEITIGIDPEINRKRVTFEKGAACDLRPDLGSFDLVIACNLICRLPKPRRFINRLPSLVRPGGQLFLTTPFSWLEAYTDRADWLAEEGTASFEALREALSAHFELEREWDMPFLIREHGRKFQYGVPKASRWTRRR